MDYYDTTTLDQLVGVLESSGGSPKALLAAIIDSAPFQQRRESKNTVASDPAPLKSVGDRLTQNQP